MKISNIFAAALAAMSLAVTPVHTAFAAELSVSEDGKRKINLSGRQRMLSQRMAKAVCFASIGVETDMHLEMISEAHQLFDTTLAGLRDGSPDLGMNPERNPTILAELEGVEELWESYGVAVASAAASRDAAQAALEETAELNVPTLVQMNVAVGEFERQYGSGGSIHPALALALNVSGRQRMLSQRASKEFCLIVAGIDVEANRAALSDTVALFETSLIGLMDGDFDLGLPEAPTDDIYEQLELVMGLWAALKDIFDAVANGGTPTDAEIQHVALDNNPLLVEMNRAVWMYDQL